MTQKKSKQDAILSTNKTWAKKKAEFARSALGLLKTLVTAADSVAQFTSSMCHFHDMPHDVGLSLRSQHFFTWLIRAV